MAAAFNTASTPTKERYTNCIYLTHCCVKNHWFKLAAFFADKSMENRVSIDTDDIPYDTGFSDTLILLGKNAEARDFAMLKFPLKRHGKFDCPVMIGYWHELRGRAFLALQDYNGAVREFGCNVPGLVRENSTAQQLKLYLFVSYLCINDEYSARKTLLWLHDIIHLDGDVCCKDSPYMPMFESIINLAPGDYARAQEICDQHVRFWMQPDFLTDPDTVPMITAERQIMLNRGFIAEAKRFENCAQEIKVQLCH